MVCEKCGYHMDAFDEACPRCLRDEATKPNQTLIALTPAAAEGPQQDEAMPELEVSESQAPGGFGQDISSSQHTNTAPNLRFIAGAAVAGLIILVGGLFFIFRMHQVPQPRTLIVSPPGQSPPGQSIEVQETDQRTWLSRRVPGSEDARGEASQRRPRTPVAELAWAAKNGEVARVRELLDQGVSPNAKTAAGMPLLAIAADGGHVECVELLIKAGADVNAVSAATTPRGDPAGITSLMAACGRGHEGAIRALIAHKADVNALSADRSTALHWCAIFNRPGAAALLLDNGANPNLATTDALTPLLLAVNKGNTGMVRILLDRGADVNARDQFGNTPLDFAVHKGSHEIIALLEKAGGKRGARAANITPVPQ